MLFLFPYIQFLLSLLLLLLLSFSTRSLAHSFICFISFSCLVRFLRSSKAIQIVCCVVLCYVMPAVKIGTTLHLNLCVWHFQCNFTHLLISIRSILLIAFNSYHIYVWKRYPGEMAPNPFDTLYPHRPNNNNATRIWKNMCIFRFAKYHYKLFIMSTFNDEQHSVKLWEKNGQFIFRWQIKRTK